MSGAVAGASAAAIAAQKKREQERKEEEEMTKYESDDLQGWEFKIVRSSTGKFNNYEKVQKVMQEEAKAGWELLEKFDDNRMRFKRKIEKRASDRNLEIDPYRTNYGMNENTIAALIVISALVLAGVIFLIVALNK